MGDKKYLRGMRLFYDRFFFNEIAAKEPISINVLIGFLDMDIN
jgi:hypothetical protein